MKRPSVLVIACLSLATLSSACLAQVAGISGAPSLPIDFSKHSDKFIEAAAAQGAEEIELGKVALQKSKDTSVDEIASTIVKDRTAANQALERVAEKEKVSVQPAVNPQGGAMIGALRGKTGRDFEAAYAQQVTADYNATIQMFQSAAKSPDPDLASFARTTLPVLNQHLRMAEALVQKTSGGGAK